MITRRLSIRPILFLLVLASACLYFFNPLSPNASSFRSLLPQNFHQFNNPTSLPTFQPLTTTHTATEQVVSTQTTVHELQPHTTVTSIIKGGNGQSAACQQIINPEDDDEEFFPQLALDAPESANHWINNPRTENYLAQLSKTQKALLDNILPPGQVFDGNMNEIGDGHGGGKGVKWKGRKEKFEQFYSLATEDEWRKWFAELDADNLPPLTKFTQEYLYRHQNPPNCDGKKFLVMNAFPSDNAFGLGAIVSAISTSLALALRTDRILVYNVTNAPGTHFISPQTSTSCGRSFNCIFLPISNCTVPDLPLHTDLAEPIVLPYPIQHFAAQRYYLEHPYSLPAVLVEALRRYYTRMAGAKPGSDLWDHISFDATRYWWRSQTAAYILRPNRSTMEQLRGMRLNRAGFRGKHHKLLNLGWECPTPNTPECRDVPMPFPLPRGSFSLHVRHGDKGIEMKLVDLPRYVHAAEDFVKRNPLGYSYTGFISTEDPSVLAEAKGLTVTHPSPSDPATGWSQPAKWIWYWSDIPRLNVGPEEQLVRLGGGNRTEMTLDWMLQLMIALEADGWVGTRGSGWNRLIDQLRCVWVASCQKPFLEVGSKGSWKYYGP